MKIIKIILFLFFLLCSVNSFASEKMFQLSLNNSFSYDIGFNNEIGGENFNLINLEFKNNFVGSVLIYKKFYQGRSYEKELFKEIKINGKELKTYVYLGYDEYEFFLKDGNKEIKLDTSSMGGSSSNLYLLDYQKSDIKKDSIYEIDDKLILAGVENLYISKNNLSENEIKIIKDFVFSGKNIYVTDEIFDKYFKKIIAQYNLKKQETNNTNKKNYVGEDSYNSINNLPIPTSSINEQSLEKVEYYNYGLGNIIKYFGESLYYNIKGSSEINDYDIESLLIDKVIKSKIVPFYVILSFLVLYFIFIIPINFYLYKKKKNRFFLVYSTPMISIGFLVILIFMNIYYKGTTDIENKLQVNYHKDGQVFSKVYIYNFTPYGGKYKISVSKEDYAKNNFSYELKPVFSYIDGNIITEFKNIYSSSILKYNYENIFNENNENKHFDEIFNSYSEFTSKYHIDELNKNTYSSIPEKASYTENYYQDILKIGITKKETDYIKKYTFGGQKNLNLEMDIYYK